MSAAIKKLALVLLIALLPLQALAAIVVPLCQQDVPTSVVAVADHTQHDGDHHDHDAPAPGHEHPFTAGDLGSDHCGAGCAFAIPMMSAGLAPAVTAERSWFAAAIRSGFIPEQPQRPPLA